MLGSFRMRLFLVLVLVALLITAVNSGHHGQIEPVLRYVMDKDYGVDERLFAFLDHRNPEERFEPVPASSSSVVKRPCEMGEIERHYGWYWNPESQKQEFNPGMWLRLEENSPIKAVLGGKVEKISSPGEQGREIRLRHGENLFSVYRGMQEVLVEEGAAVSTGDVLGKSRSEFYFELRNKDGPLNPEMLFK